MTRGSFRSASGLRPVMAFVCVFAVLLAVVVRAAALSLHEGFAQPAHLREELLPAPDFDIVDREGRVMARSVKRMDLVMSPNAMWQGHTPRRMASRIAAVLAEPWTADELLARMLPDAVEGAILVTDPLLDLDYEHARRLDEWIVANDLQRGLWLEPVEEVQTWRIAWRPEVLLSSATRAAQKLGQRAPGPSSWGRRIARRVAECALGERAVGGEGATWDALERQHRRIWRALMPCADHDVVADLPPERVADIVLLLDQEGVQEHQMRIEFRHERAYPLRATEEEAQAAREILGRWRYIGRAQAERMAAAECRAGHPGCESPELCAQRARRVGALLDCKHPRSGLEGLCACLLANEEWAFLGSQRASYRYRRDLPVHQRARRYYCDDKSEGDTPAVVTTLDMRLQARLRDVLSGVLAEHDPAVAMAIALDVATCDVLAVAGASPYQVAEFLPTWHLFTPGSTFKVIVMASALDAGVVRPESTFDTHDGNYHIPASARVIREAEGPPGGVRSAREGLAHSINAVMVQIGMRVPAAFFHERLLLLGYGAAPASGVGAERAGHVPALPWAPAYSHASVSFGHELSVSLWQHAAGLAAVARGGEWLPPRLASAVECGGEAYGLPIPAGVRVFSRAACAEVRAMMELGAEIGTGRRLRSRLADPEVPLVLASKTGTAEKVASETCLHLELERNRANAALAPGDPGWIGAGELAARPRPHRRACYTSSIAVLGRVPGEEREVLVLVVIDEPRGKMKYGSEVAGPAAMEILAEALGLERERQRAAALEARAGHDPYAGEHNDLDLPWIEGERGGGGW